MTQEGIGGYFELELPDYGGFLHDDGVLLNSGRNALEYVLRSLSDVRHLWIPYYTCDVILEPITILGITFSFYRIDEQLEIRDAIELRPGDFLLYTNYFGIKDTYVLQLAKKYGIRLIVDNAQAWYSDPVPGVSTIYSPRKYCGIPDGGIAYCPSGVDLDQFERDNSYERCSHLLKRIDLGPSAGYLDYRENSKALANQPIRRMSRLTERMLKSINFDAIREKRWKNYLCLDDYLKKENMLSFLDLSSNKCPMVYPFLTEDYSLRERLIKEGFYIASYWSSVKGWTDDCSLEVELTKRLLPLPIDQRYSMGEMKMLARLIGG